jgi:hypothetical protein
MLMASWRCCLWGWTRVAALACVALAIVCVAGGAAFARDKTGGKSNSVSVCHLDSDEDDDGEDDDDGSPPVEKRFLIDGTCTELSGELNVVGQNILQKKGSISPLATRRGIVTAPVPFVLSSNLSLKLETTRKTAAGNFNTVLELKAQRDSGDDAGLINMSEGYVSWAGWTVGYTDSLMNFWNGDFQFSANAPSRSVGRVSYELNATENLKVAFAGETGVPSSGGMDVRFIPVTFEDPVAAARALYEQDDFSLHLSGMMHELKRGGDNPLLARLGITGAGVTRGWAASAGVTVPLPQIHEDDEFSVQATYAVNSSSYLGTKADLSTLAGIAPPGAGTRGWSALASYHHVWTEGWETNLFASRLLLDIELPLGRPRIAVERYAGNVIWEPVNGFKVGTELGYVDIQFTPNGVVGVLNGASGRALVGYLFATWTL